MSRVAPFVAPCIGQPWTSEHDCWGFVRVVYLRAFGIALPALPGVDGADAKQGAAAVLRERQSPEWVQVAHPEDGDVVTMGRQENRPHHVGIWVDEDGGKIAHCDQRAGVCCHTLRHMRLLRWGGFEYFRRSGKP